MKSPAYKAGQHNLRGKKEKLLSCNCCVMLNLKQYVLEKEAKKEVRDYLRE